MMTNRVLPRFDASANPFLYTSWFHDHRTFNVYHGFSSVLLYSRELGLVGFLGREFREGGEEGVILIIIVILLIIITIIIIMPQFFILPGRP